jgi:choline dehydrogenase-like flavoprotein
VADWRTAAGQQQPSQYPHEGDTTPLLYVPKGFYYTLRGDRYTYHYSTRPVGARGQAEVWARGKGLGGSTAVNGMMWIRGAQADWDGLAARGNPAFGWQPAPAARSPAAIRQVRWGRCLATARAIRRLSRR